MIAFYMDHQVRGAVTRGLRQRGIDVLTAHDDGRSTASDDDLLDRAGALGRVMVSQDHDMLRHGRERQLREAEFHGIAFVKQEQMVVSKVIEYLELVAHAMSDVEVKNHIEYVSSR